MKKIYPEKLKKGDEVRVIAPSRSMAILGEDTKNIANQRFANLGLKLTFGKHVNDSDEFNSTTIKARIEDLHDAFSDKNVKGVITVIGGFNSNQLLNYIDWDLIKNNPKIFCGYSDITVLNNAIFTKTGLVSYYGPHYSSFGQKLHFDYTLEYFKRCLMNEGLFKIEPSKTWSDDLWFIDQNKRQLENNPGHIAVNQGVAEGTIIGGNINTLNLLQGTEFFPDLTSSILFLEDDAGTVSHIFDRDLQSLIHLPGFNKVKGLVIGRFQKQSQINGDLLNKIIKTKKELDNIPVITNVDFGHSDPKITFPVGGEVKIVSRKDNSTVEISKH